MFLVSPIPSFRENDNVINSAWVLTDRMLQKTCACTSYWQHVSSLRHTGGKTQGIETHVTTSVFQLTTSSFWQSQTLNKKKKKSPNIFFLASSEICDSNLSFYSNLRLKKKHATISLSYIFSNDVLYNCLLKSCPSYPTLSSNTGTITLMEVINNSLMFSFMV